MKQSTFKTSVNIRFDLGKKEFVSRYLPTPSHAESLLGLLKGFTGKELRSNIIIGPYGTGKSLIATIVGGLVSKKIEQTTIETLEKKFKKVHDDIYDELHQVNELSIKYLTVALNGNEGRFRNAILQSIIRTIAENNIDISLPGQSGKIIQTVEIWKQEFPKTYKMFKKHLKDTGRDLSLWRLQVLNQERTEMEWFLGIYPQLTSGAQFTLDYNEPFIDQISFILKELKKVNIGLFIAYDEFGRFLQTMESDMIHETMQDLQDLAELTNNKEDNLHLLLITHRNLSQYLGLINEEYKNEFQRIEKRFRTFYVESDRSTFIRLVDSFLSHYERKKNQHSKKHIVDELRRYPLFPDLNQQEVEQLIIEGTYPIHPVSLFLLPYLSSFFGQNERTLFTFLESNETGGLQNHLEHSTEYYLPSELFNYFFPTLHDIDTSNDEMAVLKQYKGILSKISSVHLNDKKLDIIKFITLWELAGLQSKFKLTTPFLQFALDIPQALISRYLVDLSTEKAIRFNRVLGYWELTESSSFFVDKLIIDRKSTVEITRSKQKVVLQQQLMKRFYLANEYNINKSMTRYAETIFLFSSEIMENKFRLDKLINRKQGDAILFYIVLDSMKDYNDIIKFASSVGNQYSIFCIPKIAFSMIEEDVNKLIILDDLLTDIELLREDQNLKTELELTKEDLCFSIQNFTLQYTAYNSDCSWIHGKEKKQICSELELEGLLSDIMYSNYPLTPEIRNDSFNRKKVNNMQRKAGYSVLDHILLSPYEENLAIEGQGPDYLIYATIFKNNKIFLNDLDSIGSHEFKCIRKSLLEHIQQNPQGSLADLENILVREPFGIRKPLVPILIVSLLRDKWDQFSFYRNDMYIANLDGEKIYKMLEEAEEFKYIFYSFSKEFDEFFGKLEGLFGEYENDLIKHKPRFIRVNNAMLTWLRSLSRITQTSLKQSQEIIEFKNTIKRSEIDPQNSIQELYEKYGSRFSYLEDIKNSLEQFYQQFKDTIQESIFQQCENDSFVTLKAWAMGKDAEIKKKNNFVRCILSIQESDDWVEEFVVSYLGIGIEDWTDITSELFISQIKKDYTDANQIKHNTSDFIELHYNSNIKSIHKVELSTKSQTIYQNIHRMIMNAGRNVPKEEVEYLIFHLVDEFID